MKSKVKSEKVEMAVSSYQLQLHPPAQFAIECFDVLCAQSAHDFPHELGFHGRQLPLHRTRDIQATGLPTSEREITVLQAGCDGH